MAGATSLVQLILKKWGDDIAGAAKELEEKVGFPESVANRIATGELPMDAESVARRADEQGYGDELYHGTLSDINALDERLQGMTNPDAEGTGLWMSDEPDVANSFAGDEDYTGGALYPLRVKSSNPAMIDAKGANWAAIPTEDGMKVGGSPLELDGGTLDSNGLAKIAKEEGADSITFQNMADVGAYYYGHPKASAPSRVVASLGTDNVRSPNAAFDPQYTGSNIMGGAALPVAAGLLAAGQSDDADASLASLAKRGLELASTDGKLFSVTQKGPDVGPRREVAYAEMGSDLDGGLSARDMAVTPDYRGGGLMSETYDAIEEITGKNITPSNWLSDDGAKFWVKRDRQLIEDMYNDGQFDWDDGFEDRVGRALEGGNADPRLLAGVAGTTAAGLAAPMVKDSGMISSPRSETLFDLTMGARDVERRLEGSPASLLFPSGLVDYLETVNRREEDPNAMTRGMALLDVLPF